MKKIIVLVLALSLGACTSFNNFFHKSQLAEIEAAYGIALVLANSYGDLCKKKVIPQTCWVVVKQLQAADRKAEIALDTANDFVRKNPTLNAVTLVSAAQDALASFQQIEAMNGVK